MAPELRLLAEYRQLHVFDEDSTTDLGQYWTDQAWVDALAAGGDAAAVGCVVNVWVRVDLQILDAPAVDDTADFDHVVEASMHVPSGGWSSWAARTTSPTPPDSPFRPDQCGYG